MIIVVLFILILIYLFSIPKIRKAKFGHSAALTIRLIVILSAIILLALLVAETFNVYPRQYWDTKVFFWLFIFSSMSAYGLCNSKNFTRFERVVYKTVFFLPLVFLLFLLVPFIGVGFGLLFYVKFVGDNKFILYSDKNIRIEQPAIRFMGPNPHPVIYVKKKLTSFQDTALPFGYDESKDKIEVTNRGDKSYVIILRSPDNWQLPTGVDSFRYNLKDHQLD
jgi:hypothetical protein